MHRIHALEQNQYPEGLKYFIDEQKENKGVTIYHQDNEEYIVVLGGKRTTGGYRLEIAQKAWADNQHAAVSVRLKRPGKGQMVIQSITYPHMVIKKPKGIDIEVKLAGDED